MKRYFLGDKEITEAEAKAVEEKNRETLRDGTVEELLKIRHITIEEDYHGTQNRDQEGTDHHDSGRC